MRELRFRAWDSRNNEMVHSSDTDCFYMNTKGLLFMYAIPKSESGLETIYHKSYGVEQFTGLKDKNGIDIYEGDIVTDGRQQDDHISAGVQEVEFQSGAFSPFAVAGWECVMDERKCEVIGNIHENPELLTPN